jgi:hypothetical protein
MPPGGRRVGGNCISTIIILCYVTAVPISPRRQMRCWPSARVLGACSKRTELGTKRSLLKSTKQLVIEDRWCTGSTRTPVKGGDP